MLALAAPAAAHGADAPDATDYRTEVTGLSPCDTGVTVRAVEAGARLELSNDTGATVTVLGYSGSRTCSSARTASTRTATRRRPT